MPVSLSANTLPQVIAPASLVQACAASQSATHTDVAFPSKLLQTNPAAQSASPLVVQSVPTPGSGGVGRRTPR